MVTASLPVQIDAIHPSAVYRDTVYTQDAVVSLPTGPPFEVYDIHTIFSEEHIGTTQSVELLVSLATIQRNPVTRAEIEFDDEEQPVFRGHVTDVDRTGEREIGVLDVGVGTVFFYPDDTNSEINQGDSIQLSRAVRYLQQLH